MQGKEKRVAALRQAAEQKSQQAFEKVNQAIDDLAKTSRVITFASVALKAGCTTQYLYKIPGRCIMEL